MTPPLCSAQIQLRDLPGFAEARHQLLQLRPGNRANWINFAVAHHLNGNHELAVQVQQKIVVRFAQMFLVHLWSGVKQWASVCLYPDLSRSGKETSTYACMTHAGGCHLHGAKPSTGL